MKVVNTNTERQHGENVKEYLSTAVDMADKESVSNLVIIMTTSDGGVIDCWANSSKPYEMIGAIEGIKQEFMSHCIQGLNVER